MLGTGFQILGDVRRFKFQAMINISLCLSDLPKEKIKKAQNGKKYINLCIAERKSADKYGNTHTLWVSQTKEEREQNISKTYVGNGKEYTHSQPDDDLLY